MPRTDRFTARKDIRYRPFRGIGGPKGRNARLWKASRPPTPPPGVHRWERPNGWGEVYPLCFPSRKSHFFCLKRPIHSQLNWAILLCLVIPDGKTEQTAQFWQTISQALELFFPVVFHTENCAVHSGNPSVSSVCLPTPRWHHLKAHPFLAIHSADEHRMIYSFSSTTSYSTFYAFFSSFRITLWPMWLANSKRQTCFYPP
jgi:hypothetical protein